MIVWSALRWQAPVAVEEHLPKAPLLKAHLEGCEEVLVSCLSPSRLFEPPPPPPPGAHGREGGRVRIRRRMSQTRVYRANHILIEYIKYLFMSVLLFVSMRVPFPQLPGSRGKRSQTRFRATRQRSRAQ